jgi:hypothetical protein
VLRPPVDLGRETRSPFVVAVSDGAVEDLDAHAVTLVGRIRPVTRFQILYWQDVPSLVRVLNADGSRTSYELPDWFQQEIDRRAMEQGLIGSDAYLEQWHWSEPLERSEPEEALVDAVAAEFRATDPRARSS